MKKVLLLGDSIRMGYDSYVKELLPEYEVYYDNDDNGRFSSYTIWQFNVLNMKYGPFDLVHFNNGYWDMNREGPKGERAFSIDEYIFNYRRLLSLIKETGAIPVFATIIPLLPEGVIGNATLGTKYTNEDVIEYNNAAKKLMAEENVQVNDLYSLILKTPNFYKCPDKLHLLEEGYQTCAKQVASTIKNILK